MNKTFLTCRTCLALAITLIMSLGQIQVVYAQQLVEFQEFETIPTNGAGDWESFTIGTDHYLAVTNHQNGSTWNIDSKIYQWDSASFVQFQAIPTNSARDWESFTIGTEHYLAVANENNGSTWNIDSKIYRWNGTNFVEFQSIPTNGAHDWEYFTIGTEHYLAVANFHNGSTNNLDSKIYQWNGASFVEVQALPTNGAADWEFFTIGTDHYLAVANYYNGSTVNIDSKIYKALTQGNTLTFVPSAIQIEPQIDNTLSVDLVVDGDELYGLQVDCNVDPSVLAITGYTHGSFFDTTQRLEIGPNFDAVAGTFDNAISLRAPATAVTGTGTGPFASLNFTVADTTATVSVATCTALFSGIAGEELSGTVSTATIVVDNGIHGGTGSISGQLTIPGASDYCGIVVTLTNSDTGRTLTTTTDCNGNFSFEGLRDGDYTIVADFDNYVLGCTAVSVSGGAATVLDPIAMLAGDLNNDGSIGIADFTLMAASFGLSLGDDDYNSLADINGDDTVNIFDLTILGAHFGIDNTTCP